MLFDLRPKEKREELYGREKELEELHRLTESEWVVVLGRRMTGKTSLLKVFLNEVDGLYVNLAGVRSMRGFVEELMKHARKLNIEITMGPLTISWTRLAEDVFSKLEGRIIGLDEVQELPRNYMLKLLKKVWDTYDVKLVFTGSLVGVITGLLEPTPQSPLYGRQPAKIELKPFPSDVGVEFLEAGFREFDMRPPRLEVEEAVESLGGYPGWLAYYGNMRCVRGLGHREALEQVYSDGKQVLIQELKKFLAGRKNPERYVRLLKLLPAKWSELETALGINAKVLSDMLDSLERAMIIEKKGNTYTIPDPIMRRLVLEL
ncbi:ATP-binding protein [Thermogladius sp. KZ2Tp1]|uniref:AAA family ATPase n=1 Tax=Thermogladius sp. KZ2Tp1 TaxID=3136289 RepID=UPI003DA7BD5F